LIGPNSRTNRWIGSHTDGVMMKSGPPPQQMIEHFQKNNILLDPLMQQMPKYDRISRGTAEEMVEFWPL
jgi:hypothetical protein